MCREAGSPSRSASRQRLCRRRASSRRPDLSLRPVRRTGARTACLAGPCRDRPARRDHPALWSGQLSVVAVGDPSLVGSEAELDTLRTLNSDGKIVLREADSLEHFVELLDNARPDVATIGVHGTGEGLSYRLTREAECVSFARNAAAAVDQCGELLLRFSSWCREPCCSAHPFQQHGRGIAMGHSRRRDLDRDVELLHRSRVRSRCGRRVGASVSGCSHTRTASTRGLTAPRR